MPAPTIDRPVSALRQRMLEDMAMRGLRSVSGCPDPRLFGAGSQRGVTAPALGRRREGR